MVCLANLKKLTHAWILYADDNDGNLVNGEAGQTRLNTDYHINEPTWVGQDWIDQMWKYGINLPQEEQKSAIKDGALWSYCRNIHLYHCPSGRPGELRNYSIVDSMNGNPRYGTHVGNVRVKVNQTYLWLKNRSEIRTPNAAYRAVFIDEGRISPDSYAVNIQNPNWWDDPPVRHSNGATLSFADAHAEHWRWKSQETIDYGWSSNISYIGNKDPITPDGEEDLYRLQKAVWVRLDY